MTTIPATVQERISLPAAAAPAKSTSSASFGDVFRILKQRAVLVIMLGLLLSFAATGAFFFFWFNMPSYSSEGWVQCDNPRPETHESMTGEARGISKDEHERFITSQAAMILSPNILNEVLKTAEVRNTSWFKNIEDETQRFAELAGALQSVPIRNTNYVKVQMSCRKKEDPAPIVQQVLNKYLSNVQESAKAQYRGDLQNYKEEESRLNDQINEKLTQIRNFTSTLPAGTSTGAGGIVYEQLRLYAEQVAALELQTLELEGLSELYNRPEGPGVSAEDRQLVEQYPLIAQLTNTMSSMDQELRILKADFGENHREVKALQNRRDESDRLLSELRDRRLQEILSYRREQVRTAFLNSQHALLLAREKLAESEAAQSDLDRRMSELQTLNDELTLLKDAKGVTSEYIRDIDRIITQNQTIQVKVARPPTPPLERSFPRPIMLPAGIILAFMLSSGLAILLEFTDTSVRTPQDIVRHLNIPMLGVVPDVDDEEMAIDRIETAVKDAPNSMVAEAFRTIRTNLQFSAPAERLRTIVVTSPRPDDGKTAIAANLAVAVAQAGRRVLLVDANFRRPALHKIFNHTGSKGLSNLLVGEGQLDSAVAKTDIANLDVLFSGPTPPNPAERLASPQLQQVIDAALAKYDQIIFDAPPLLIASDSPVLASRLDGAILVCRAKENSRGIAQRACGLLAHVNAHLFGAVLNAAQSQRGGYFREQMAAYYDYKADDALPHGTSQPVLPEDVDDIGKA